MKQLRAINDQEKIALKKLVAAGGDVEKMKEALALNEGQKAAIQLARIDRMISIIHRFWVDNEVGYAFELSTLAFQVRHSFAEKISMYGDRAFPLTDNQVAVFANELAAGMRSVERVSNQ